MRGSFKLQSLFGGLYFGTWTIYAIARDAVLDRFSRDKMRPPRR